jgi:hypothetical protein
MSQERDPHKAVDYIIANATKFAKAKSERVYLEEYRKSLKAILMKRSLEDTIGGQEREAYAHDEYKQLLEGLKVAIEMEEKAPVGSDRRSGTGGDLAHGAGQQPGRR